MSEEGELRSTRYSKACWKRRGKPTIIPEKIKSEVPLPTPLSVICSARNNEKREPEISINGKTSQINTGVLISRRTKPKSVFKITVRISTIAWISATKRVKKRVIILIFRLPAGPDCDSR